MDSYDVLSNGQVMKVFNLGLNEIREHFDMFYHVKLTADKVEILPNDIDKATIKAKVFDYLDNPVNYSGEIEFDVEGERFSLPATNGEAVIEVTSDFVNQIDVSGWILNARAGVCVIYAKASTP